MSPSSDKSSIPSSTAVATEAATAASDFPADLQELQSRLGQNSCATEYTALSLDPETESVILSLGNDSQYRAGDDRDAFIDMGPLGLEHRKGTVSIHGEKGRVPVGTMLRLVASEKTIQGHTFRDQVPVTRADLKAEQDVFKACGISSVGVVLRKVPPESSPSLVENPHDLSTLEQNTSSPSEQALEDKEGDQEGMDGWAAVSAKEARKKRSFESF